jgi:hypothetical protein
MTFVSTFKNSKEYSILLLLYFVSNIFLLLNVNGIYWDDWWILGVEQDALDKVFYQLDGNAGVVRSKMIGFLSQIGNGVLIFRVLTFLLYFLTTLFVFKILQTIKALTKADVFFITLIFMAAPLNPAKALAVAIFPYAVSLTIFFFGFYLLSIYLKTPSFLNRLSILALFFASFLTNSLLVFYAIPLMYIFYQKYQNDSNGFVSNAKAFIKQKLDFIVLPFLFFIIRALFFKPSGVSADYNSFDIWMILGMPITIPMSFYSSFLEPISQSFVTFMPFWILGLGLFLIPFKGKNREIVENNKRDVYFLLLGGVFFVLAVFPYLAVGKLPQLGDFASRHQLLVPLGFSFILYFFIKVFSSRNKISKQLMQKILMVFIMAFVVQNIYTNYQYKLDWFYQVGIEQHLKDLDVVRENTTFVVSVDDEILEIRGIMNAGEHTYRLNKIFGDKTRLMIDESESINSFKEMDKNRAMDLKSWVYHAPIYLKVSKGRFHRRLFLYEFFDKEKFEALARKLITVKQVGRI